MKRTLHFYFYTRGFRGFGVAEKEGCVPPHESVADVVMIL